jgi:uncharacterized protein (DUF488 family)
MLRKVASFPPSFGAGVVYSIGHSTLAADAFFAALAAHEVRTLADVRAHPGSRRHPHFARAALAAGAAARDLAYHWMPGLGGRRRAGGGPSRHPAWEVDAFRHYADYADTAEFAAALALLTDAARAAPTAFMCAEALWWQCHRRLIADHLLVAGWDVRHVGRDGAVAAHRLPEFARVADGGLVYDVGVTPPLVGG